MGNRSLFKLIAEYILLAILLAALDTFVTKNWPDFLSAWSYTSTAVEKIKDLLGEAIPTLLTVQAALIWLVFPVAIGLVTLLVQRKGSGSTNANIQVYYKRTFRILCQ